MTDVNEKIATNQYKKPETVKVTPPQDPRTQPIGASLVAQKVKTLPAMLKTQFDPWMRKIPWRREWLPLQFSPLENPMDRGTWQAIVCGVTKSRTCLNDFHFNIFFSFTSCFACNVQLYVLTLSSSGFQRDSCMFFSLLFFFSCTVFFYYCR